VDGSARELDEADDGAGLLWQETRGEVRALLVACWESDQTPVPALRRVLLLLEQELIAHLQVGLLDAQPSV
jgi:hypothetical protein